MLPSNVNAERFAGGHANLMRVCLKTKESLSSRNGPFEKINFNVKVIENLKHHHKSKLQAEQSVLDRIHRRQRKWYGHLLRMEDNTCPKIIYQWTPHGRRRRERPQQLWKNQVIT